MSSATLYGVGLGPGDPELMTLKAARLIESADVIAYHSARHGRSIARSIAAPQLRGDQLEEALVYPVTTETTDHPGGYEGAITEFYEQCAKLLATHLDAGRDVVLLCEGDPFFYGSYMYMHERLAGSYHTCVVPGVTSLSAASAELGKPLAQRDEVLTLLPGTLPEPELARRLADTDAAAVLKLGRTHPAVHEALTESGRLDEAAYVERASWSAQRVARFADVDAGSVPYFSVAVVPSPAYSARLDPLGEDVVQQTGQAQRAGSARVTEESGDTAEVAVVGLGPGGPQWLTPQARQALEHADHVVGYGPYVAKVPVREGQRRHASGNRVEADRACDALRLAAHGARVAVVSSGDPGVFAMASAVYEQAERSEFADVAVRVLPGVTAAQAAAARIGAPLGHDYCVLSLSDRLKPWEIIERRLDAAAAADLAIAIYNPASRSRKNQLERARAVLLQHRDPNTPVLLARDIGGAEESARVVTLGELAVDDVDMRCMLIVGSSHTRLATNAGESVMWTPRTYEPDVPGAAASSDSSNPS